MGLQVYMSSAVGAYDAVGIFDGRGITVLKNSTASVTVARKWKDVDKRAAQLTSEGVLKEDTYFGSPNAAAFFICGHITNGWEAWKTASGEALQSLREKGNALPVKEQGAAKEREPSSTAKNRQVLRTQKRIDARIKKEFEKKFFIGDIVISDQEYDVLLKESKQVLRHIIRTGHAASDSVLLAVTLVQIGIRKYDGRYFWPYVEKELGFEHNLKCQQLLGESFINTLRAHGKHITDASERVQNILFHGFVSNYYSKGLFELLFQYYSRDLERDIYRNTTEQMQALMDTLAKKAAQDEKQSEAFTDQFMAKGSRAYKLKNHTLQAISAHPVHSRTRLRRLIRLIDQAFWKNIVPKNPTSRLSVLFKEWVADSQAYKKEYRLYQQGEIRNRGKKHFSAPYLFANIGAGCFDLKMPAQIVAEEYADELEWEISTCSGVRRLSADTYPVLTGYKTEEAKIRISQTELFGDIQCRLVRGDHTVRRFPHLPESPVRFFDMEGDYAPRLFKIPMCAYTAAGSTLHSRALLSEVPHGNMIRWDFEFQQGDLVILPDGTGMIAGDYYCEGLVPRGRVLCAEHQTEDGTAVPIYASAPELLLALPKGKLPGTILYCNDVQYRLSDCRYTEFENRDARGIQAVLLPLEQFDFCESDGLKTVVLDIPGAHYNKKYSFALVKGFFAEFPGSPYVFEERGAVLFPNHIKAGGEYDRLQGENGYSFTLSGDRTQLQLVVNGMISVVLHIPVLSWSSDKVNWNVLPAGEMWHTEFFEIQKLYLRSPIGKISIFTDADIDDESDDGHMLKAECGADGICTVDMTRFRSWLTRDVMKNDILLKLGSEVYPFATVYTRSLVASHDVSADYEEGKLIWISDIIGKADYYLDIVHLESGTVLAEKKPLNEGKLELEDRLRTGLYRFTLYEAEEDDSGFDDPIYEELLQEDRQLTNRNDVSGQFLEIRSFKPARNSNLYTAFKKKYYVSDFEKLKKDVYEGQLLDDGEATGLKVTIEFLRADDMRFFHVTAWHKEEEVDVDLLYDRDCGTLELDQPFGMRFSESYRRYRELTYGDFLYFGVLHDKLPDFRSSIPEEMKPEKVSEPVQMPVKPEIPIERLGLSSRSYHVLFHAGILNVKDLVELPADQWLSIRNMSRGCIEEIAAAVSEIGFTINAPQRQNEIKELEKPVARPEPAPVRNPGPVKAEQISAHQETTKLPPNRDISLSELNLPQNAYFTLLQRGVETAGDIADLTPFMWKQMTKLKNSDLIAISEKMKELGLRIRK